MSTEPKKQMPKGGRKGGRQFPQLSLKEAVDYAKRLVSKTHTGPQPASIVLTGVFVSGTNTGKIRASALKQYGLMDGTADAYRASDLAKNIVGAPPQESHALYQLAALKPDVFKSLYDTFKGDTVPHAKIRQQASNLEVHPENLEKCVKIFIESAHFAGLGHKSGDDIVLDGQIASVAVSVEDASPDDDQSEVESDIKETTPEDQNKDTSVQKIKAAPPLAETPASGRSVIHVNIGLDSSLDTEKLERQLALLRRYGAI